MKNKFLNASLIALLGLGVFSVIGINQTKNEVTVSASSVDDYYKNADTSTPLKLISSLKTITTTGFKSLGYDGLLTAYHTTDKRSDGYLFDWYSKTNNFVIGGAAENRSYSKEGDGYNREHSIPKSWWGGEKTNQGCDVIIVVPTDGYVNNRRSNFPFGETNGEVYKSNNSYCKLGSSTFPGYSGKVFEPGDDLKGDFARIYMYAIVRWSGYKWSSGEATSTFSGSLDKNCGFTDYAKELFLKWNAEDPVDDWERTRNNNVQTVQGNRNPFVDHPEWIEYIWGNGTYTVKKVTNLEYFGTLKKITYVENEAFNPEGITVMATYDDQSTADVTSSVSWSTITATSTSVTGSYTAGGVTKTVTIPGITVKKVTGITKTGTATKLNYVAGQSFDPAGLTITAEYDDKSTDNVTSAVTWAPSPLYAGVTKVTGYYGTYSIEVDGLTVEAAKGYSLVNNTNELADGDKVVFAYPAKGVTAGDLEKTYLTTINTTFSSDKSEIEKLGSGTLEFTAKKSGANWSFEYNDTLLGTTGAKNVSWGSGATEWSLSVSNGNAELKAGGNALQYNESAPRFTTYSGGQKTISIYHLAGAPVVHVTGVTLDSTTASFKVGEGIKLAATVSPADADNKTVSYSSSNTSVATVSSIGSVLGVGPGTATITVTTADGGFTATCTVTVTGSAAQPTISLNKTALSLKEGATEKLVATTANADGKTVVFTTSDATIATVAADGTVTAIKEGSATITATIEGTEISATCALTVTKESSPKPGNGCTNSIVTGSAIITIVSGLGLAFLSLKRKKEN